MRYAFINELGLLAKRNKNILLLTADLGYSLFENFAREFPNQFLNVGVAEANMVGVAAGLALSGKTVFVYSIATFVTLRTFEQIRNDVCVHNASVVIVGSGAGFSYPDNGPSHHALEDIAVMRTLPNIVILAPSDPIETVWATKIASELNKPVYLRLGKRGEPNLNKHTNFYLGKVNLLEKGSDIVIFSYGNMVNNALQVSMRIKAKGISCTVVSLHTLKPFDQKTVIQLVKKHKIAVTLEEHSIIGGLGSIVSEALASDGSSVKLLRIGVPDIFTQVAGSHEFLRDIYSLSVDKLVEKILSFYIKNEKAYSYSSSA